MSRTAIEVTSSYYGASPGIRLFRLALATFPLMIAAIALRAVSEALHREPFSTLAVGAAAAQFLQRAVQEYRSSAGGSYYFYVSWLNECTPAEGHHGALDP